MENFTLEQYQKAYRSIKKKEARAGFFSHIIIYIAVNALLACVNYLTNGFSYVWIWYPLLGWAVGVVGHYILLAGYNRELVKTDALAEKMAREEAEKEISENTTSEVSDV